MNRSEFYSSKKDIYSKNVNVLRRGGTHYKIIDLVGTGQRILDVGCSAGYLGKELKKKGNTVYGVEISKYSAEQAKQVLDGVVVGDIEEIDLPYADGYFDFIICADILEHLFNPINVLTKLKKVLKRDGKLIAVIPNIAYWKIRINLLFGGFEYKESGILDEGHVRFYTYNTSRKLFSKAGLDIVKVDSTIGMNRLIEFLPSALGGIFILVSNVLLKLFPRLFACNFIFILKRMAG